MIFSANLEYPVSCEYSFEYKPNSDGFSSSSGPWQGLVRECMNQLEGVFFTQIKEIYNEVGVISYFLSKILFLGRRVRRISGRSPGGRAG